VNFIGKALRKSGGKCHLCTLPQKFSTGAVGMNFTHKTLGEHWEVDLVCKTCAKQERWLA